MNTVDGSRVVITGVDMTLGQLTRLMFKVFIASLPVMIAIWILTFVIMMIFAALAGIPLMFAP